MEVWARMLTGIAAEWQDTETLMIDATHLKAHRTASSLRGQGGVRRQARAAHRTHERPAELQAPRRGQGAAHPHVPQRRPQKRLSGCPGDAVVLAPGEDPGRGSGLRCGLVPLGPDRPRHPALHPRPKGPQRPPVPHNPGSLPPAPPHREHVRTPQGLAQDCHPLRLLRRPVPVSPCPPPVVLFWL